MEPSEFDSRYQTRIECGVGGGPGVGQLAELLAGRSGEGEGQSADVREERGDVHVAARRGIAELRLVEDLGQLVLDGPGQGPVAVVYLGEGLRLVGGRALQHGDRAVRRVHLPRLAHLDLVEEGEDNGH